MFPAPRQPHGWGATRKPLTWYCDRTLGRNIACRRPGCYLNLDFSLISSVSGTIFTGATADYGIQESSELIRMSLHMCVRKARNSQAAIGRVRRVKRHPNQQYRPVNTSQRPRSSHLQPVSVSPKSTQLDPACAVPTPHSPARVGR